MQLASGVQSYSINVAGSSRAVNKTDLASVKKEFIYWSKMKYDKGGNGLYTSNSRIMRIFPNVFKRFRYFLTGLYDSGKTNIPSVQNWSPVLVTSDSEYLADYDLIRARSRDLYKNNSYALSIVKRFVSAIVGRGLRGFSCW